MNKFAYWLCFVLVAVSSLFTHSAWVLYWLGVTVPGAGIFHLLTSFGTLVPTMFSYIVPRFVLVALGVVMLFLVVRRLWLLLAKREGVPHSFVGFPKGLAYVGAWSFTLAFVGLLLSVLLKAGSGVPAGMLAIPAIFCVPWAFFLVEVLSFRSAQRGVV